MIAIHTAYTKYFISAHHAHGARHVHKLNCVNDVMTLAGPVTLNASVGERRAQQLRHRKVAFRVVDNGLALGNPCALGREPDTVGKAALALIDRRGPIKRPPPSWPSQPSSLARPSTPLGRGALVP